MVSGIDDRLHRRWTRPGQTLRGRVNHRAREPPKALLKAPVNNSSIVLKRHHHCENNELSELSVLRYKEQEVHAFVETLMPHAIQIRQTGDPEVLNWTPIEVDEPGSGQVRLRQAAAGLNYIDVYHRTGYYSQPLPFIPGLEGAGTVEAIRAGCAWSESRRIGWPMPVPPV